MWVVTGPFDEDHSEGQAPDKSKLLKTGREYGIGRKDQPILIKSKAISKAHALFVVGSCDDEQAADPTFVPTLTFSNITDRARPVERPSLSRPRVLCQSKSSMQLLHGDIVHLSASIFVRVHWEKICCYHPPGKGKVSQISVKDCTSLGVQVVPTLHADVTHHLTPSYALTASIATSIISVATLVKPDWLVAVLNSGKAEPGELSALEERFVLPPTSKYRPSFSPSLPPRLKKFNAWEPNEARAGMFNNCRFIFIGEKGAEAQNAHKEIVKRGGGDYECLAVDKGAERLSQVLSKGKARGATLVLVAATDAAVAAVGDDGWNEFVEVAKSFQLKFVHSDKLVEAVIYTDISYVCCTLDAEDVVQKSVLPDVIPNTIEDEPSIVPLTGTLPTVPPMQEPQSKSVAKPESAQTGPRRKLPRRAASRTSSRAPSPPLITPTPDLSPPDPVEEVHRPEPELEPPRRTLVRRAARAQAVRDLDESSMDLDTGGSGAGTASEENQAPASQEPPRRTESVVPPTPARPSRLKRRVGTQAQSTAAASQLLGADDDVLVPDVQEERPYKRHKSLFDEADPDRIAAMSVEEYGSQRVSGGESLTQIEPSVAFQLGSGTQSGAKSARTYRSGKCVTQLGPLAEEEEESTPDFRLETQTRGTKRKTEEEDEQMSHEDEETRPKMKRRTDEGGMLQAPPSEAQTQAPQTQASVKPMSKVVTRVDMAQSEVHVKSKSVSKKAQQQQTPVEQEPDKDHAFLKAVASTKRGKKSENTFDREFNNLRISKPDLEKQREDEEWKVLEEFGDDGDVRGNFMVVVEIPVYRADVGGSRDHLRRGEGRLEWQGRQDFKRFKRKAGGERRPPVELVVEEENDLGIGSQYWKGSLEGTAPQHSQSQTGPRSIMTQRFTQPSMKERPPLVSDSDDEEERPVGKPTKGKSHNVVDTQKKRATRGRGKAGSQKRPLFIDSDEDDDEKDDDFDMGSDDEQSNKSGADEELGATFRSSGRGTQGDKGKTAGRKKAPAVVIDDDSDDGATFKAFGARARTRRK